MKSKIIKQVIAKKVKSLLESVKDPIVRDLMEKNIIVTGGCITSMLLKEKVNDFDIYFRDKATTLEVAKYYVKEFHKNAGTMKHKGGQKIPIDVREEGDRIKIVVKSAGVASAEGTNKYQYFEGIAPEDTQDAEFIEEILSIVKKDRDKEKDSEVSKYRPLFITSNAITLSDKVQLVIRFYGNAEEIHKNFDFVHVTNYWTSWDKKLELNKEALAAILSKELIYVGSKYPLCSIFRLRKFIQRGWHINGGQIVKMCFHVNDLDLANVEVLEDQLIGMDTAYFSVLIQALREDIEKSGNQTVNPNYVFNLIDKLF